METSDFYTSPSWRALSERARRRDGGRCTVARLLGGCCTDVLHAHHIESVEDRPDLRLSLDNIATVCSHHHPIWEKLRRTIKAERERARNPLPPCRHVHPYREGRLQCARQRAKRLGLAGLTDEQLLSAA